MNLIIYKIATDLPQLIMGLLPNKLIIICNASITYNLQNFKPGSPALHADSLLSEPSGKPIDKHNLPKICSEHVH